MQDAPMVTMYNAWSTFLGMKAPWSFYERLLRDLVFADFEVAFRFSASTQQYQQRVLTNAVLPHLSAFAAEQNIFILKYRPKALYACIVFSQMLINEEGIVRPTDIDEVWMHSAWSLSLSLRINDERMIALAYANGLKDGDPARFLGNYFPSNSLVARRSAPAIYPDSARIFRREQKHIILDQFLSPTSVVRPLVYFAQNAAPVLENQFETLPITGWGPTAFLAGASEVFYSSLPQLSCKAMLW